MKWLRVLLLLYGGYFFVSLLLWALPNLPLFSPIETEPRAFVVMALHISGIAALVFALNPSFWEK